MAHVRIRLAQLDALPPVCVCCGAPATRVRRQEFRVAEPLSAATLAASVLAGGLAWTERGVALTLPVCDRHRRRGRKANQTFARGAALAAGLAAAAYLASWFGGPAALYLGWAAGGTLLATVVAGMHEVDDGLKVTSLEADGVTLTGVSRGFAEAVGRPVGTQAGPVA